MRMYGVHVCFIELLNKQFHCYDTFLLVNYDGIYSKGVSMTMHASPKAVECYSLYVLIILYLYVNYIYALFVIRYT